MTQGRWNWVPRRLWQLFRLVLGVAAVAGIVYWLKFSPVAVVAHPVGTGEIVAEVMGTGTLEAHFKTTISPRISGRITEVLVDIGDRVTTGKLLARLDDVELRPQVEVAQASVTVAQATLERLKADRVEAMAVLERAAADHKRAVALLPQNAVSQADADKATADWKAAQAAVARAEAALVEGRKQLAAAETNRAYRQAPLSDTEVLAPEDGLIVQRQRDPGDIAVPGTAILTLISTKELWIAAWVDETEMSHIAVGQPTRVVFRSEPNHDYRGAVARYVREADRETREYEVDVRVLELPKNWAVGQRAEVYIQTARKTGVTLLPAHDILWRDGKPGVFVAHGQYAAWRGLTLGLRGREVAEVLSGLAPDDAIVAAADGRTTGIEGRRIVAP